VGWEVILMEEEIRGVLTTSIVLEDQVHLGALDMLELSHRCWLLLILFVSEADSFLIMKACRAS
jgi:hypothetical protein